jgi:hypothetical protein
MGSDMDSSLKASLTSVASNPLQVAVQAGRRFDDAVDLLLAFCPRRHLQHLQRSASSHLRQHAPSLPSVGHADLA